MLELRVGPSIIWGFLAEAVDVRQQALEKDRARTRALARAQYRKWNVLGGAKASEAKIVDYENGMVTMQKRDGKTVQVREVMPYLSAFVRQELRRRGALRYRGR
jgi:hypothetical protein